MITQDEKAKIDKMESIEECLGQILWLCNSLGWSQNYEDRRDRIVLITNKAKQLLKKGK